MLLHIKDDVNNGHRNVSVRSVDSDIVVLAVGLFNDLAPLGHYLWKMEHRKTFTLMKLLHVSVQKLELCPYSMHYLGVTATHPPPIVANLQSGMPGTLYPD